MRDLPYVIIAFLFLMVLTLPLSMVLFSTYGGLATVLFLVLPLAWFIMDSDISHYSMDEYLE